MKQYKSKALKYVVPSHVKPCQRARKKKNHVINARDVIMKPPIELICHITFILRKRCAKG